MNHPAPQRRLKIGVVASISGLSVKTIRYYEDIGLLAPTVLRAESGYRLFDVSVLERLAFIKRAQSLGLSLTEVHEILQVHDQGQLPCGEVKHHLQEKMKQLNDTINALLHQRSQLEAILSGWNENPTPHKPAIICPNLQD
jgi:MerR family copper efflux transcriptional regulator